MNSILLNILDQSLCIRLTATLLNFLWEGLAIGLCAWLLAWLCRTASAQVRYGIHVVSLALMALCVPLTYALVDPPDGPRAEPAAIAAIEPAASSVMSAPERTPFTPQAKSVSAIDAEASVPVGGNHAAALPAREQHAEIIGTETPAKGSRFEAVLRTGSPYAAGAYLLGVVIMLGRLCCALWGGHRLRRCATPIRDRHLLLEIRRQAARIGLKVVPIVAYCERITIPVVAGILRPVILLPAWLAAELFFHPAVWYVSRQLSLEREICCDDAVVRAGHESVQYASTLVRMAELCTSTRRPIPANVLATLAASGSNGSQLKRRTMRLLGGEQRLRLTRADSLTLVLVAGLIAATMAGAWHHAFAALNNDTDTKATVATEKISGELFGAVAKTTEVNENALTPNPGTSDEATATAISDTAIALSTKDADGKEAEADTSEEVEFGGKVVDADGKPVKGAEIWFAAPPPADESNNPAAEGIVRQMGLSDQQGHFSFRLKPVMGAARDATNWTYAPRVSAKAPGYGFDWLPLAVFEKNPVASARRDEFRQQMDKRVGPERFASQSLKLPPDAGPVRGRLVDLEGRPLADVAVSIESIYNPDVEKLSQAFEKSARDLADRALYSHTMPGGWITRHEWRKLMPPVKTNDKGEFSLTGLARDQMAVVTLLGERVAAERLFILGREMETKRLPHLSMYQNGAKDVFVGTRFTHAVGPAVPVDGLVTEFKSGKPISNATVYVERLFRREGRNSAGQLRLHTSHIRATTDEQGRYRLLGVPPGERHVLNVIAPKSDPWLMASQEFSLEANQANLTLNVQVFRGIWIEGRVTDAATGEPISGHVDYLALRTNPNIPQRFGLEDAWELHRFPIDGSGHYRVPGLPGPGVLLVRSFGKTVYPLSVGAEKVDGYDPKYGYLPTTPSGLPLSNWNRIEPIDPPVDAKSFSLDLTLTAGASVPGRVVGPDGAPASGVEVLGLVEKNPFFGELKDDKFTINNYEPAVPRNLFFKSAKNSLVGHVRLEGAPPAELKVAVQPAVTVRGQLIETETDVEAVGYHLYCESTKQGDFRIDDTETDENGRFEIKGLLAGNVYTMDASNPQRFVNRKNGFKIDLTKAKPGDVIELGEVTGKKAKSKKE
ncbi:MAG: hypothetical protein HY290_21065 [Planctomycetia bacterium]|nr:hypothetical protein [Planctomycetia bacterium]